MTRVPVRRLRLEGLEEKAVPAGTLFFNQDSNPNGLFTIDPETGAATLAGAGNSGVGGATVGLAQSADPDLLFGSQPAGLVDVNTDGSGATQHGATTIEGLAFDPRTDTLYGTENGNLFTLDPVTGGIIANLTGPGADVEGLSEGEPGFLYGLTDGGDLLRYDIAADSWNLVGNTFIGFTDPGLAYDAQQRVLYAKGAQDADLYTIDPLDAGFLDSVDTGLAGGGGLAFAPAPTAGFVTAGVSANGTLTLTGDAAGNGVRVTLNAVGVGTTVAGLGNTTIVVGGISFASFTFGVATFPPVKQITANLKEGDDLVRVSGTADFLLTRGASFNLGSGDNTVELATFGKLAVGGLTVSAADGFDSVYVKGGPGSVVGGSPSFNLGDGGSDVTFDSVTVAGSGGLTVRAGEMDDALTLLGASVNAGPAVLSGGGGVNELFLGPNAAGTPTTVAFAARAVGNIETYIYADGATAGGLDLQAGAGRGGVFVLGSGPTTVNGSVTTSGSDTVVFLAEEDLTVKGNVDVSGRVGAHVDVSAFALNVTGSLTVRGNTAELLSDFSPFAGAVLSARSVAVRGGDLAEFHVHDATVTTTGDLRVSAAGEADFELHEVTSAMTVGGELSVYAGFEALVEIESAVPGSARVKGNMTVTGGIEDDDVVATSGLQVDGSLTMDLGAGLNEVDVGTPGSALNIGRDLAITAGVGDDSIRLTGVRVLRDTRVTLGGGRDKLVVTDGSSFTGTTTFNLGTGDDLLDVATDPGASAGVTFSGRARFNLGDDNDTARIGRSAGAGGNAVTVVTFALAGNVLDLGAGLDTFVAADAGVAGPVGAALRVLDNGVFLTVLP